MIIAAMRPYSSEAGSSNSPKISPPYSIVRPSMATSSSNVCTSSEKSRISVWSRSVMLTWAKAIVPSGLIWLGFVVRAGDGDALHRRDLVEDALHRRLDLGIVDPLFGTEHDLAGETGIFGADRLELIDHFRRLGVGEREVGAEGADRRHRRRR